MPRALQHASNRKLSAVLHADIQGYGSLMDRDEAGTIERVTRSLTLIRDLVRDYGGNVENVAGDGVLALFPTPRQALHFAVEMQREMSKETTWSSGEETIAYRIGIAIGEITAGGGTLHGHSINLAARLQSIAPPGGICVSETVYQTVRDKAEFAMQSLGRQALKNIAEPVEVFSVSIQSDRPASGAHSAPRPAVFGSAHPQQLARRPAV